MAEILRHTSENLDYLTKQDFSQTDTFDPFKKKKPRVLSELLRAGVRRIKERIAMMKTMKNSRPVLDKMIKADEINVDLLKSVKIAHKHASAVLKVTEKQIERGTLTHHNVQRLEKTQDLLAKRIKSFIEFEDYLLESIGITSLVYAFMMMYKSLNREEQVRCDRILRGHKLEHLPDAYIDLENEQAELRTQELYGDYE